MTGDEKAIQTQAAADAINKSLSGFSEGAAFFGMALCMAEYLNNYVKEADRKKRMEDFMHVAMEFSTYFNVGGKGVN